MDGARSQPSGAPLRLRLQVEGSDVLRAEDRDGSAVERRDAANAKALGGRDEDGVDQPRAMFGRFDQQLGRAAQVVVRRGDQPDRPVLERAQDGQSRGGTELPLQEGVQLGEGQRPEEQRLVGSTEPGDGRGVVEVRSIRGGDDGARV